MATLDWDDIKHFLALSRHGSVRAASNKLGISHSTVARRIEAFEKRLGVRLFERSSVGYALTAAGEEVLISAEQIESEIYSLERRIVGRDQQLSGSIKITMFDVLCTHLLMPHLTEFTQLYPEISLEVSISYEPLDLGKREADIALRCTNNPPGHLIGKHLVALHFAPYGAVDYLRQHDLNTDTAVRWIGYGGREEYPAWVKASAYPHIPVKGVFESILLQFEAAKSGMGIAMLPCFMGDPEPILQRLTPDTSSPVSNLWLLTHTDMRTTARLRVFSEFIAAAVFSHRNLIEGRAV